MALTSRISLVGPPSTEPEDFISDSLGVIFPDDVTNQHGDAEHALLYTSPHLPKPLLIQLSDPAQTEDRLLFSHFLWNASLLLAEFVEAASLGLELDAPIVHGGGGGDVGGIEDFDVRGLDTLELGSGTALPSIMAALLGVKRAVVTDYPAPTVMDTLRHNVQHNTKPSFAASSSLDGTDPASRIQVEGHAWGELDTPFAAQNRAAFDRLLVCDCLWMPWQHANLRKSIAWFLKPGRESRAWVVAGFHTGRAKMSPFFDRGALAGAGLAVDRIWERDCDGVERAWVDDRGPEDITIRKRWLVVAILRRLDEPEDGREKP